VGRPFQPSGSRGGGQGGRSSNHPSGDRGTGRGKFAPAAPRQDVPRSSKYRGKRPPRRPGIPPGRTR
jgi:hypothetical protein